MSKIFHPLLLIFATVLLISCGDSKPQKEQIKIGEASKSANSSEAEGTDEMSNKGIGPVTSIELNDVIDEEHALKGKAIFEANCTACHKFDKKFVGPALGGVTERRTPEWIMNMILNPEEMVAKDPIAKRLLIESNMAMMANQNMTEEQSRAILEYFRSLDQS